MKLLTAIFVLNATILVLHEIESAYEREWEILQIPGGVTGFLLLHIPVILLLFYAAIGIEKGTVSGLVLGVISGLGGILPFLVHVLLVPKDEKFDRWFSKALIYSGIFTGAATVFGCARALFFYS